MADLGRGVGVELGVVGDELDRGVPDLLGREFARAFYQLQAHVNVPLQGRVEPGPKKVDFKGGFPEHSSRLHSFDEAPL